MEQPPSKKQLRRCGACQKVGHNKSTCTATRPVLASAPTTQPLREPLRFFIHHVNYPSQPSQHIVDLKKETDNVWEQIEGVAPEKKSSRLYHSYHELPKKGSPASQQTFAARPIPAFESLSNRDVAADQLKLKSELAVKPRFSLQPTISALRQVIAYRLQTVNGWGRSIKERLISGKSLVTIGGSVVIIILVAIIPGKAKSYYRELQTTKNMVLTQSTVGFMRLQESTVALQKAEITDAETATRDALQAFNGALAEVQNKHHLLQTLISLVPSVNGEFASRQKILLAGQEITVGNAYLLEGVKAAQQTTAAPLTERLTTVTNYAKTALPNYQKAFDNLDSVDSRAVPVEYQAQFNDFKKLFGAALTDLQNVTELGGALQKILGKEGLQRYLIIFQNNHELRPTGGFMGSFALVDIKDGMVVKLDIPPGGSYDVQGQLTKYVEPPTPLSVANKRWQFHDANWFPDFPTSAQKIEWFYRHSRNVTVDGVIAINATVLERLLTIVGPITDSKRHVTLTAQNALATLQEIVEEGPEKKENKPKQIISDLAPLLFDYLKKSEPKNLLPLLFQTQEALEQKEIQLYFNNPDLQATIASFGWGGIIAPLRNTNQDYLFVVSSNILGSKSDAAMEQMIAHESNVATDGTITDTVTITRMHSGKSGTKLYGERNISYLRVYVPEGSELISANGFSTLDEKSFRAPEPWYEKDELLLATEKEIGFDAKTGTRITEEFGKSTFGNWIVTEPGETSVVTIVYRLPFILSPAAQEVSTPWQTILSPLKARSDSYQLVVQKQSGISGTFESQIIIPDTWKPVWNEGENSQLAQNGMQITKFLLQKDMVWNLVMSKESN